MSSGGRKFCIMRPVISTPWSLVNKFTVLTICQGRAERERSDPEWGGITPEWEGIDNKSGGTTLALGSCAVSRSTVTCVVAYFRRTELLPGVSERSGID